MNVVAACEELMQLWRPVTRRNRPAGVAAPVHEADHDPGYRRRRRRSGEDPIDLEDVRLAVCHDELADAADKPERLANTLEGDQAADRRQRREDRQRRGHDRRRLVRVVVGVLILRLAEEGQQHEARGVDRGKTGGGCKDAVRPEGTVLLEVVKDLILRPEAGEDRNAGERETADREGDRRDRHLLTQATAVANLLLLGRVNDRPGAEEEQRLEEGVREQVEHRRGQRADTEGHEHEA